MARVELDNITKVLGDVVAVENLHLTIGDGEFVAILGPSGCGKSTTLFMLAGIYEPTGGELRFDGYVVNEVEARDRNVGIVFQSYALYPHLSVRENIMFPLKFKKVPTEDARRQAEEVAKLVHVEELLDRKPSQMSGGQQQRVALARALVKEPQLLLLDEPLSNLDATLRLTMRTEIKKLQQRFGLTTILVTHDQVEATTMADRIICMSKGRIEQVGSPEDLYLRPQTLFVATFIGAPPINQFQGDIVGGKVNFGETLLDLVGSAAVGRVTLGIRPEYFRVGDSGLVARVDQIEPMGRETLYMMETPLGATRVLDTGTAVKHAIGEEVRIDFDPEATLLFDGGSEVLLQDTHVRLANGG